MSTQPASAPHVLIIGGGLGGLALAQALRKRNVSCAVFERDLDLSSRAQGWAISLQWILEDLVPSTPDDLPPLETVSNTYNVGLPSEAAGYNLNDGSEIWRIKDGDSIKHIRVDRAKFRSLLATKVDVHWGKKFMHYEQDENGVTAFFDDGSSYRGDMLVGADGISSHVRDQLLNGSTEKPKSVRIGLIMGEMDATKEQYERWFQKLAPSFYMGDGEDCRLFVGLKGISDDLARAHYYWMYSWADDTAQQEHYWTATASQKELHNYVMEKISRLPSQLTEPVSATPIEGILHPPIVIKDMVPQEMPKGRVTLLGDAIHPMTPFRGEGGNNALKDALDLARAISAGSNSSIASVLLDYEKEMIPRATKSVLASRAAAEKTE